MLTGTPLRALLQTSRGSPRPALQNPSPSEHRGVAPGAGGGGMRGSTPHTGRPLLPRSPRGAHSAHSHGNLSWLLPSQQSEQRGAGAPTPSGLAQAPGGRAVWVSVFLELGAHL